MRDRTGEADQPALVEDRRDQREVRQVTGGEPGIVGDDAVARPPVLAREDLEQVLGRPRHDEGERGRGAVVLRHQVALGIHQHAGVVVAFAHDGGEGSADQRRRRLVCDGDQPAPEDFERDRVEAVTVLAVCRHVMDLLVWEMGRVARPTLGRGARANQPPPHRVGRCRGTKPETAMVSEGCGGAGWIGWWAVLGLNQ